MKDCFKGSSWEPFPAWQSLGFRPDGELYYQYRVRLEKDGFVAEAFGDLDCNGKKSRYWMGPRMKSPAAENEIE